jgi:hypothetical protein
MVRRLNGHGIVAGGAGVVDVGEGKEGGSAFRGSGRFDNLGTTDLLASVTAAANHSYAHVRDMAISMS